MNHSPLHDKINWHQKQIAEDLTAIDKLVNAEDTLQPLFDRFSPAVYIGAYDLISIERKVSAYLSAENQDLLEDLEWLEENYGELTSAARPEDSYIVYRTRLGTWTISLFAHLVESPDSLCIRRIKGVEKIRKWAEVEVETPVYEFIC